MTGKVSTIPVVDLFAGPGGLGEGFTSFKHRNQRLFKSVLSIKKERSAHATLRLRSFFRLFPPGQVPEDYYRVLRGELALESLYERHSDEARQADEEARCLELGGATVADVRRRIVRALDDADPWVLLGGSPCQPLSLTGYSGEIARGDTLAGTGEIVGQRRYTHYGEAA